MPRKRLVSIQHLAFLFLILFGIRVTANTLDKQSPKTINVGYLETSKHREWYRNNIKRMRNNDNIIRNTPSQIMMSLFDKEQIDLIKIDEFYEKLDEIETNHYYGFCIQTHTPRYECQKGTPLQLIDGMWKQSPKYLAIQAAKHLFKDFQNKAHLIQKKSINRPENQTLVQNFFTALEILEALKGEDEHGAVNGIIGIQIVDMLLRSQLEPTKAKSSRMEASNLVRKTPDPSSLFYSHLELEELKKEGADLGDIDPFNSTMWQKPTRSLQNADLIHYMDDALPYLSEIHDQQTALDILDPEKTMHFQLDPNALSIEKDRFVARFKNKLYSIKFQTNIFKTPTANITGLVNSLLNNNEMSVESVANNIAYALGFNIEPTFFKKKVRINLPEEFDINDFMDELKRIFPGDVRSLYQLFYKTYMESPQRKRFFDLYHVSIEKIPESENDKNLGVFRRHTLGKSFLREHRGYAFFQALIEDPHFKTAGGSVQFKADQTSVESIKLNHINSEMGGAFGFGLPNIFSQDFVKKSSLKAHRCKVKFRYRHIHSMPILKAITCADARWLLKRFAQIPREAIEASFIHHGFPEVIAKTLTLKLMGRKNQALEALGMLNRTIKDDQEQDYVIKKSLEFTGSIPGYEKYFDENGLFKDDKGELASDSEGLPNVNYGIHFKSEGKDKSASLVYKNVALQLAELGMSAIATAVDPGMFYTGHGLQFAGMNLDRNNSNFDVCQGTVPACFFQGFGVGVGTFLPLRFIADNPDPTSPKRFWIIDLFRIGISAGVGSDRIDQLFSLKAPTGVIVEGGAIAYRFYEFIKIHPTDDLEEYTSEYYKNFKTPSLMFENAKQDFVKGMETGDFMILSTYMSQRARVLTGYTDPFRIIGPTLSLQTGGTLLSRVTLHKESPLTMRANWAKLKRLEAQTNLGLRLGLNLNIFTLRGRLFSDGEDVYSFAVNDTKQEKLLLDNLSERSPPKELNPYKERVRHRQIKERKLASGLLDFIRYDSFKRHVVTSFKDFDRKTSAKEFSFEREIGRNLDNSPQDRKTHYRFTASVNENSDIYLKSSLYSNFPNLRSKDFHQLKGHLKAFTPRDFIDIDESNIKHYLGDVTLKGEFILSSQGLKQFFALPEKLVCERFAILNQIKNGYQACHASHYLRNFTVWSFMKDFQQARRYHQEALAYSEQELRNAKMKDLKIFKYLGHIVDILSRYTKKKHALTLISSSIEQKNFSWEASLSSSSYGLPNQTRTVEIQDHNRGLFKPKLRHLAANAKQAFALFSDKIHGLLSQIFLENLEQF